MACLKQTTHWTPKQIRFLESKSFYIKIYLKATERHFPQTSFNRHLMGVLEWHDKPWLGTLHLERGHD